MAALLCMHDGRGAAAAATRTRRVSAAKIHERASRGSQADPLA